MSSPLIRRRHCWGEDFFAWKLLVCTSGKGRTEQASTQPKAHLLLEISNCIFIRVGEGSSGCHVLCGAFLQVVHQVCSIALRASQNADKYIRFWTKRKSHIFTKKYWQLLGVCINSVITPWVRVLEFLNFENESKKFKILGSRHNHHLKTQVSGLEKSTPKLQATHSHLEATSWVLIKRCVEWMLIVSFCLCLEYLRIWDQKSNVNEKG